MATPFQLITIRGQHRCSYCSQQFYRNERGYRQKLGAWPNVAYIYLHERCMPLVDATPAVAS